MDTPTIAIIGAGNMGNSLLMGLIKHGHPSHLIWAADPAPEKLAHLKQTYQVQVTQDNTVAVDKTDIVIFAIKPQYFSQVAEGLQATIQKQKPLIISVAAGIRIKSIQDWLGEDIPIVRAMPNTPALIGCGATALVASALVSTEQQKTADRVLSAVGMTLWLNDEHLLDAVTALSGSGPAYFFLVMEALQAAGESLGLTPEVARALTLQTALGSAQMAATSDKTLVELRRQVTSPGGTTEKAIMVFEESHIRDIFKLALEAAKIRSQELARRD